MQRVVSRGILFNTNGPPSKVLQVARQEISLKEDKLLLKFLASPINPSDINQIQGVYPIQPRLPGAFGGNEGVAQVVGIGSKLQQQRDWALGQLVIPSTASFGTWRSYSSADPDQVIQFPNELKISVEAAATMSVNVFSAYRMLKDFPIRPGQTLIQNASNSGVGRAVIQLARHFGYKSINVIRKRANADELVSELRQLGADDILFEDDLTSLQTREYLKSKYNGNIVLGLNCVGGSSALNLSRLLENGSTLVTYGAMSREPFPLPASLLIFKDIRFVGFWMARWKEDPAHEAKYLEMVEDVCKLYHNHVLKEPKINKVLLKESLTDDEYQKVFLEALERSQQPMNNAKELLYMDN